MTNNHRHSERSPRSEESLPSSCAGYVLAGGASKRFGPDKALIKFAGQTVLDRMCAQVHLAAGSVRIVATVGKYSDASAPVVPDGWPGEGPLGGIITALRASHATGLGAWNLILGCDLPFITSNWLCFMVEHARASDTEVIVPRSAHGLEPLCACWRTSALATLQAAFDRGIRKVTEAMKLLPMEILDETHWKRFDSGGRLFWNMNTPEDYQEAVRVWKSEHM